MSTQPITYRAMTHDDEIYPDPDVFKPERFFNKDGTLNDDDHVLAYGFGRRYSSLNVVLIVQTF